MITAVKTDPSQRHKGMSLLVIERGTPGFERGRNLDKIGQHAQDTAELSFTDVRVPVTNLLGPEEGHGFTQLVTNLPQERLSIAISGSTPPHRAGADPGIRKERKAFGHRSARSRNRSSGGRAGPETTIADNTWTSACGAEAGS